VARLIRIVAAVVVALPPLAGVGCGKDEGKPNPELKVPDIPASSSTTGKADALKDKKQK